MSDWDDYLAAARRLDGVRRQAASVVDTETATVRAAAREELDSVRQRLDRQRNVLILAGASSQVLSTDATTGAEASTGSEAEPGADLGTVRQAGAGSATAGTDAGAVAGLRALRTANAHLEAADAILSGLGRPGHAGNDTPVRRNALVYGCFAVVVLAVQLTLFGTLKDTVASMVATAAGAVLPLVGFALSWLLIGLVFGVRAQGAGHRFPGGSSQDPGPTDPGQVTGQAVPGRVDRTPLLGAAISLAPVVVLCAGLGTAALLR